MGPSHRNFITTANSLPLRYFLNKYLSLPPKGVIHVCGPEGSGKTTLLKCFFYSNDTDISNNRFTFHQRIVPEDLHKRILTKMDTYRKKLVTPMTGYHETRILLDDVWMKYQSDTSSLEVIRNLIDKKGLYCESTWKTVSGLRLAVVSRSELKPSRINRHCFLFQAELSSIDLIGIYTTLITNKLSNE